MRKHGANPREVELTLALASLELDLVLSREEARLHGQARKPGRRRVIRAISSSRRSNIA